MNFPQLIIPDTLAAGPGPGNTDPRVLAAFGNSGIADHMQADVIRGMQECKVMLRELFGTKNIYTYGIAGTGWSGLDSMHSAIQPGDKVVAFNNGTFSGIDCHTIRMKASLPADFAAAIYVSSGYPTEVAFEGINTSEPFTLRHVLPFLFLV